MVLWHWCIVRNGILHLHLKLYFKISWYSNSWYNWRSKIPLQFKCLLHGKCEAYTFDQSRLNCILHQSGKQTGKQRGKQTGLKKADYLLSLLEISYCSNKNRKRRCRSEPKCMHVNCLRKAQDCSINSLPYWKVKSTQTSKDFMPRDDFIHNLFKA